MVQDFILGKVTGVLFSLGTHLFLDLEDILEGLFVAVRFLDPDVRENSVTTRDTLRRREVMQFRPVCAEKSHD